MTERYREAHALPVSPSPFNVADVWQDAAAGASSIRVCVRKRPMLRGEQLRHDFDVVAVEESHSTPPKGLEASTINSRRPLALTRAGIAPSRGQARSWCSSRRRRST